MEPAAANPETVERLILQLMEKLKECGEFTPPEGLSAVMTFTYRFSKTILELSPGKDARAANRDVIVMTLKRIAALIEFEEKQTSNLTVH